MSAILPVFASSELVLVFIVALSSIAEGAPPQQGPGKVRPAPAASAASDFRLDTGATHVEPSSSRLDQLYSQWKNEREQVKTSSKEEDYTTLPSFRAIVALGWWGLPQLQRMVEETGDSMLALAIDEISGKRRLTLGGVEPVDPKEAFGIYLLAEPVDPRIFTRAQGDWSGIRLADPPVISAADIISYDLIDHSMQLRTGALARLPRPIPPGIPFVVLADGKRIYLGAFTTCLSSIPISVPSIMVDRRALVTNQPPDVLVIERAYPQPSFGVGPDPRGDSRIKAALAALGKLRAARRVEELREARSPDGRYTVQVVMGGTPDQIAYQVVEVQTGVVLVQFPSSYQPDVSAGDWDWRHATGAEIAWSPDSRYIAIDEQVHNYIGEVLIADVGDPPREIPFPKDALMGRTGLQWERLRIRVQNGWLSRKELSLVMAGKIISGALEDGRRTYRHVRFDFTLCIENGRATISRLDEPKYDR